jgi:ABC-2 type transport system ATP-binding protein
MNILRMENVTKIYRRQHLGVVTETTGVRDLSLEVAGGEIFGLLGLNGSGKTTTIKLILGLLYPTTGTIEVMGRQMPDPGVLKRIGYLPEAAYLNKYLTGKETVNLYATISGLPRPGRKAAVEDILDKVGMKQAQQKRVSEYSKGMLQRISIAQALVHNPDILVFDEPITGLDPLALKEIRQLILWLKSQGKTVFFSSHNISEVERVCDRIGILVSGKLSALVEKDEWKKREGRLEEIFTSTVKRSENMGSIKFIPGGE